MKVKFSIQEIQRALGNISGLYNTSTGEQLARGLSNEKIALSEKVRLNLICNKLHEHYTAYESAKKSLVLSVYPKGLTEKQEQKLQLAGDKKYIKMISKINEMGKESFEIEFQPISIKKIEGLVSDNDYSWLLSKISDIK